MSRPGHHDVVGQPELRRVVLAVQLDVVAADAEGRIRVGHAGVHVEGLHVRQPAQITGFDEVLDEAPAAVERAGRHQHAAHAAPLRLLRLRRHLPRLVGGGCDAGLAQDVLAGVQRRQRHLSVRAGRRADEHGIDIVALDHLAPVVDDVGYAELCRNLLGVLTAPVGDRGDLAVRRLLEARQHPVDRERAGADDPDSNLVRHEVLLPCCAGWPRPSTEQGRCVEGPCSERVQVYTPTSGCSPSCLTKALRRSFVASHQSTLRGRMTPPERCW